MISRNRGLPAQSARSCERRLLRFLPRCVPALMALPLAAGAHNVSENAQTYIESVVGPQPMAFAYLGAKHMITGYDHLLYLLGIVFFLHRAREVAVYVTLFAAGHSATLLLGVLGGLRVDPFIVDAVIGLSVAYKAFENVGGFRNVIRWRIDARLAVFFFGLCHGLGLATKLQDLNLSAEGLLPNLFAFNVGVELGQLGALALILLVLNAWRGTAAFGPGAFRTNIALMSLGFLLAGYQMAGFALS